MPVVVRDVPEEMALEMTLVENLQREDLNPIEQAHAFQRLIDEFHLTQEQVAERTGKDRATIANAVRLLKLEDRSRTCSRKAASLPATLAHSWRSPIPKSASPWRAVSPAAA